MQGPVQVLDLGSWHAEKLVLVVQVVAVAGSSLPLGLARRHPKAALTEWPVVNVYRSQRQDVAEYWGRSYQQPEELVRPLLAGVASRWGSLDSNWRSAA